MFMVSRNQTKERREGKIYFSSAAGRETVTVYQGAKADGISESVIIHQMQKDALVVAQAHYSAGAEGGTIDIEVGHNIDFEIGID